MDNKTKGREKEKKRKVIELQSKTYSYQKLKESQGEPKAAIISSTKIKRPLGEVKEDHLKLKKLTYKIFFKHFKLQHPTTRVCL